MLIGVDMESLRYLMSVCLADVARCTAPESWKQALQSALSQHVIMVVVDGFQVIHEWCRVNRQGWVTLLSTDWLTWSGKCNASRSARSLEHSGLSALWIVDTIDTKRGNPSR